MNWQPAQSTTLWPTGTQEALIELPNGAVAHIYAHADDLLLVAPAMLALASPAIPTEPIGWMYPKDIDLQAWWTHATKRVTFPMTGLYSETQVMAMLAKRGA